jgi:hypothetical protein
MTPAATLVKEANRKVEPGTHELVVLTNQGPQTTKWDPMDEATTAIARQVFDRVMSEGAVAYSAPAVGESEVIRHFDEQAEHVIVTNPLVGG